LYKLNVDPRGAGDDFFKESYQSFEESPTRFYNPKKVGIDGFSLTITPKCSIPVKNLVVRELATETYKVKDATANVFVITLPQLSYGFISYLRLEGDYAKMVGGGTIIWRGMEFVKK